MEPSPTQVVGQRADQNAGEQIRTRIASGEFGTRPDINFVNQAWEELLANEVRGRGRKPIYHVCGLWNDSGWTNDADHVLLSGIVREFKINLFSIVIFANFMLKGFLIKTCPVLPGLIKFFWAILQHFMPFATCPRSTE